MEYIAKYHRLGLLNDVEKGWWDDAWKTQKTTDWDATGGKI